MTIHDTLNLVWCSSQSMAVHSSGHSIAVQSSGPSMAMMHGGQGAGLVGPLQDKLNRLLLSSNSPSRPSTSGGLIPAGRYDTVSSSLSTAMRVRSSQWEATQLSCCAANASYALALHWHRKCHKYLPAL